MPIELPNSLVEGKKLFDADKTKELKLSFTPIKTYPVHKLEKMGVVTKIFVHFADDKI